MLLGQRRVRQTLLLQRTLHWKSTTYPRGGGDSGGVRSSWRYFDVSKSSIQQNAITLRPTLVKLLNSTEWGLTVGLSIDKYGEIGAIGVDGDGLLVVVQGTIYTWNEAMALEGLTPEAMAQMNVIEITEEEFLNNTFTKE